VDKIKYKPKQWSEEIEIIKENRYVTFSLQRKATWLAKHSTGRWWHCRHKSFTFLSLIKERER
jgi:hypothetical protein